MGKNSENALIARGVDTHTASTLSAKGHTLQSLKQRAIGQLIALGIKKEFAETILSEPRPRSQTALCIAFSSRANAHAACAETLASLSSSIILTSGPHQKAMTRAILLLFVCIITTLPILEKNFHRSSQKRSCELQRLHGRMLLNSWMPRRF